MHPDSGSFRAVLRPFSLEIHKVFLRKNGLPSTKIPRCPGTFPVFISTLGKRVSLSQRHHHSGFASVRQWTLSLILNLFCPFRPEKCRRSGDYVNLRKQFVKNRKSPRLKLGTRGKRRRPERSDGPANFRYSGSSVHVVVDDGRGLVQLLGVGEQALEMLERGGVVEAVAMRSSVLTV